MYKSPNNKGLSLIELLVTISLVILIVPVVFVLYNPTEKRARARDEKRLSDISTIERSINEFLLDKKAYPDLSNITRTSTSLPSGNSGPLENSSSNGWIKANLATYTSRLPTDPINDIQYHYTYRHTDTTYEINAVLEVEADKAQNDGGNDSAVYEVGNDLTII